MPHSNIYFDFLVLCELKQSQINNYAAHISPAALALFLVIALRHSAGATMTISGAMALSNMASSAALHKRIDDLREAGMICIAFQGTNRRTKYLAPSQKGDRYLKFMGQLLRSVAKH